LLVPLGEARAAALLEETVAEVDCGIVEDLGLEVGEQVGVADGRWDEAIGDRRILIEAKGTSRT